MPRSHTRYPLIPGHCFLTQAEEELFPGIPYAMLSRDQKEATVKHAKVLYERQTGVPIA